MVDERLKLNLNMSMTARPRSHVGLHASGGAGQGTLNSGPQQGKNDEEISRTTIAFG